MIQRMPEKPTLIHRYTTRCHTVAQPPGFADFLKGTVYLYQQRKRLNNSFDLLVDFTIHPVGQYLIPIENNKGHQQATSVQFIEIQEFFNTDRPKLRQLIANIEANQVKNEYIYMTCHEPYDNFDSSDLDVLDNDDQKFMQSVLKMNEELEDLLETEMINLDLSEKRYCVVHVRIGDHHSSLTELNKEAVNTIERKLEAEIIPTWGVENILLVSDSLYTKLYFKNKYGLKATNYVPVHMGEACRFINTGVPTSAQDIQHTLLEFFFMSKAKEVYVYSVYGWKSGFSKLCCHIFNIPYHTIEP